jgi:hypothetical protein
VLDLVDDAPRRSERGLAAPHRGEQQKAQRCGQPRLVMRYLNCSFGSMPRMAPPKRAGAGSAIEVF